MRALICSVVTLTLIACGNPGSADKTQPAAPWHRGEGGFRNPYGASHGGGVLRYWQSRLFGAEAWATFDPEAYRVPAVPPQLARTQPDGYDAPRVTWLGQATALIQYRGVNVLTDPMLSLQAGPTALLSIKRISPPGLRVQQLPRIHVVVLSHDHYDHLDLPTLEALDERVLMVVPLGLRPWLIDAGFAPERIRELDWWQSVQLRVTVDGTSVPLEFTATPAQHVSGRGPFDRNDRLWASWAIALDELRVFFAGDTGYNEVQFAQVGARLGPFDLALLPIGSYGPRDFMAPVHADPSEAVKIHRDVGSRRSLAIHWGTFFLSAEHPSAPPEALAVAREKAGIPPRDFQVVPVGHTEALPVPLRASGESRQSQ